MDAASSAAVGKALPGADDDANAASQDAEQWLDVLQSAGVEEGCIAALRNFFSGMCSEEESERTKAKRLLALSHLVCDIRLQPELHPPVIGFIKDSGFLPMAILRLGKASISARRASAR
eukprot:TRINITY_DN39636_c0_g1_i3.p2 TRINITY_DN39636_c0_g1~~TRINITY_DN39636_c0_g1_i3.p2  ORF type:complete len:119 (-),score=31.45 TRINITY_DN39636_c0_g1_i3:52-408(-)